MSICTYCGQSGHVAATCSRRGEDVSQRRLVAEAEFRAIRQSRMTVETKKSRTISPERQAAWLRDLAKVIEEIEGHHEQK